MMNICIKSLNKNELKAICSCPLIWLNCSIIKLVYNVKHF